MKARDVYESDIKRADKTLDTITRIKKGIDNFGVMGNVAIPGTERADWKNEVEYLINRSVTDLIAEMKSQSSTGATGFGALNREELNLLRSAATKLRVTTTPGRAKEILDELERDIMAIREKKQTLLQSGIGQPNWIGDAGTKTDDPLGIL